VEESVVEDLLRVGASEHLEDCVSRDAACIQALEVGDGDGVAVAHREHARRGVAGDDLRDSNLGISGEVVPDLRGDLPLSFEVELFEEPVAKLREECVPVRNLSSAPPADHPYGGAQLGQVGTQRCTNPRILDLHRDGFAAG
jgi:hypothetical protein